MEVSNSQQKECSSQGGNYKKGSGYVKKSYSKTQSKFQGQQKGGKKVY